MVPYLTSEMAAERTRDRIREAERARRARVNLRSTDRVSSARRAVSRGLIRLGVTLAPTRRQVAS